MQIRYAVACDTGGTRCKMGLVDCLGDVISRDSFSCVGLRHPDDYLVPLFSSIERLSRGRSVSGIGVLLPGYLRENRTVPHVMVNIPALQGIPLAGVLRGRFGVNVALDIDRNGPARAEFLLHVDAGVSRLLYVTIGTGLGVGLVVDGEVCRLTNDSIGELGHVSLDPNGATCACGNIGCAETMLSRSGVVRIAQRLGVAGELLRSCGPIDFARELSEAAAGGNADALRVYEEFGRHLGMALVSYANMFSPDLIVLGGGLVGASEHFLPIAERWLSTHWLERASKHVVVRSTKMGSDAGLVGAASLVLPLQRSVGVRP